MTNVEYAAVEEEAIWLAVQLKPNSFRIAERSLLRQNFCVFCPKIKNTVVKFGKPRTHASALFSGYLFVQIDNIGINIRLISNTHGVSRIITNSLGTPAYLPDAFINGLLKRCDAEGYILPPETLSTGDSVRLAQGPLNQFVAKVERIDEHKRIWILLDILGGTREVEAKIEDLVKEYA